MLTFLYLAIVLYATSVIAVPAESTQTHTDATMEYTFQFVNASCDEQQTECDSGCCPFPEAVCCIDGKACCHAGQVCIPYADICIGIEKKSDKKKPTLVSDKTIPIIKLNAPCPSGTTTCAKDKCCIFPNATCCSDGEHCCPNGYSCDIASKKCIKSSEWYSVQNPNQNMEATMILKAIDSKPHKSCPGGSQKCPSHTSCCVKDDGSWGCCLNPSTSIIAPPVFKKFQDMECCNTFLGWACCVFPIFPYCTFFGCI